VPSIKMSTEYEKLIALTITKYDGISKIDAVNRLLHDLTNYVNTVYLNDYNLRNSHYLYEVEKKNKK